MRKQSAAPAHFPIRAVSRLTGIGIDTLRAWERRHAAVTPTRDDRGRMYTDADVARLRLLKTALERGHSIGRLAALSDKELRTLGDNPGDTTTRAAAPLRQSSLDTTALMAALQRY